MSGHTPGPWISRNFNEVGPKDCLRPLRVRRFNPAETIQEVEANARLIAAAPELLEAAKLHVAAVESRGWCGNLVLLQMFKDAIAKAEGKT